MTCPEPQSFASLILAKAGNRSIRAYAQEIGITYGRVYAWSLGKCGPPLSQVAAVARSIGSTEGEILASIGYSESTAAGAIANRRNARMARFAAIARTKYGAHSAKKVASHIHVSSAPIESVTLRDYQIDLAERVAERLRSGHNTLMVLPTGGGKTAVFVHGVWGRLGRPPMMVIVHTRVLAEQWGKLGIAAITWQHLYRRGLPDSLRLVVWDEAHHSPAECYRKIRQSSPAGCVHLGLTATPYRSDGMPLNDLWSAIETGPQTKALQDMGHISRTSVVVGVPPDLSGVGTDRGASNTQREYVLARLGSAMQAYQSTIFGNPVEAWKQHAAGRKTITFCATIKQANHVVAQFTLAGIRAELITGKDSKKRRDDIFELYRAGAFPILVSVAILNEGFDMPECECIHILRPTRSRVLWRQMIGRGLRPSPNPCKIIDQGACYFHHGLVEDEERYDLEQHVGIITESDRSEVVFEQQAAFGPRHVREVKGEMIAVDPTVPVPKAPAKPKRIYANPRGPRDKERMWINRRCDNGYVSWRVRVRRASRVIVLGTFHSEAEAIAWSAHNQSLMASGLPFEKAMTRRATNNDN